MKDTIIHAAKEGGAVLKKYFRKEYAISYKEQGKLSSIVTEADIACEKKIFAILKKKFPDYNILSEETGAEERGSLYTWIIDPLDGTQNFVLGLPEFGVAIALAKRKEIIMSVLYFPMFGDLYFAEKRKGAFLNGKKISVSSVDTFSKATVSLNFEHGVKQGNYTLDLGIFLKCRVYTTRCAIFFASFVSSGKFDGAVVMALYPWDVAATSLLVLEAGGKVTGINGNPFDYSTGDLVVSNGKIHDALLGFMKKK
ncbi:MAG: inositol monophosphatase family protein [Nanoarchaeota archaeon]